MWNVILVLPLSAALSSDPTALAEPRTLETIQEIRAELERLKAENLALADVQAQLEAYEAWRRNRWRGGRFGVDPLPVQESASRN